MKRLAVLLAVGALAAPAITPAAVLNDEVTSVKLKEADGTSGQNTNSGAGVKTGHIQDGAVTAAKLGITCPAGNYLKFAVPGGWVCSVGTPGPQGPVGPQGPAGPMPQYANVVVVAKSGGDFADPVTAMAAITTASEAAPVLLRIMPGVYDLGATPLDVKPWVDVEGAGPNMTVLAGSVASSSGGLAGRPGLVNGQGHSSVRHLTVRNEVDQAGDYSVTGLYVGGEPPPETNLFTFLVDDVVVRASAGATGNATAVLTEGASIRIRRAQLEAWGARTHTFGVYHTGSFVDVQDTRITLHNDSSVSIGVYGQSNNGIAAPGLLNKLEGVRITMEGASTVIRMGIYMADYVSPNGPYVLKDTVFQVQPAAGPAYPIAVAPTSQVRCIDVFDANYQAITTAHDGNLNPFPCP